MSNYQKASNPGKYDHNNNQHYLVQVNQQYKCVCQLCNCGKHKCPRPQAKGQFETSYNSHYKNTHIIMPTTQHNYIYPDRHYHMDSLKTNYKESYNDQPLADYAEKLNSSRLENIGKSIVRPNIPQVPFYGNSSYTEQYKPFVLKSGFNPEEQDLFINRRQKIPDYGFKSQVKFEDSTAYKEYYQSPSPQQLKYPHPVYSKPEVAFKGSSSYKDQYKGYAIQPRYEQYSKSIRYGPKVKFQGNTTYNDLYKDFKVMPQEKSSGKGCPFDKVPQGAYLNSSPHMSKSQQFA